MMAASSKRAAEILNQITYVTVATVGEGGQPWNSPVYSAFDEELNIYWTSDKNGQHSQNIRANGKAFLVVYDSTVPEGEGEGIYNLATTQELTGPNEIRATRTTTQGRKGQSISEDEHTYFSDEAIRRVYKAVPQHIWMNSDQKDAAGRFMRDIRVELSIEEIKRELSK
jgi:hypothetical protein